MVMRVLDRRCEMRDSADRIRLRALHMVAMHGTGYLGQVLSSADWLAALYSTAYRPDVDRLVCSPGHYAIAVYATAAEFGLIDEKSLDSYGRDGSALDAIGSERSPGVDMTSGSLGLGLSSAIGFALADELRGFVGRRTFILASDGELQEGQTWEAALVAGHRRLTRLTLIVDANDSQGDGPLSSVTTVDPIAAKWRTFGWSTHDVDGHDLRAVAEALAAVDDSDRPTAVICRTSSTHGLAALPPDFDSHLATLTTPLVESATIELHNRLI